MKPLFRLTAGLESSGTRGLHFIEPPRKKRILFIYLNQTLLA